MSVSDIYIYVSTRAGADPARTVILCAPDAEARDRETLAAFAHASGWLDEVEADGGVLVAPCAPQGWAEMDQDAIRASYQAARATATAPSCVSLPGRAGAQWLWEPLIYVVGYQEGAQAVGDLLVAHPAFAAAALVVDGSPRDYAAAEELSDHWFVPQPSQGYATRNCEVPVAAWLMGSACDEAFLAHLRQAGGPDWRLRVSPELTGCTPDLARMAMREFFQHVVRWKNSPDGELSWRQSRTEFYLGTRFAHASVECGGNAYHYAVHVPQGMSACDTKGLPIVFSIHGRGEPSWLFADKNGWEDLADETQAFVVVVPDSPRNVWAQERDADVLAHIIDAVVADYGCDRSRVYLCGFSNGAAYVSQQASTRPELFASASPWNCPPEQAIVGSGLGSCLFASHAAEQGFELPLLVVCGDADDKGMADRSDELPIMALLAGCELGKEELWDGTNHYTADTGYTQGERMCTRVFRSTQGRVQLGLMQVRDMPHGAMTDEARAAWEFMRRFRRPEGAKTIEEVGQ